MPIRIDSGKNGNRTHDLLVCGAHKVSPHTPVEYSRLSGTTTNNGCIPSFERASIMNVESPNLIQEAITTNHMARANKIMFKHEKLASVCVYVRVCACLNIWLRQSARVSVDRNLHNPPNSDSFSPHCLRERNIRVGLRALREYSPLPRDN